MQDQTHKGFEWHAKDIIFYSTDKNWMGEKTKLNVELLKVLKRGIAWSDRCIQRSIFEGALVIVCFINWSFHSGNRWWIRKGI